MKNVTIKMSVEETAVLYSILSEIGGLPTGPRQYVDSILNKIDAEVGYIEYDSHSTSKMYEMMEQLGLLDSQIFEHQNALQTLFLIPEMTDELNELCAKLEQL